MRGLALCQLADSRPLGDVGRGVPPLPNHPPLKNSFSGASPPRPLGRFIVGALPLRPLFFGGLGARRYVFLLGLILAGCIFYTASAQAAPVAGAVNNALDQVVGLYQVQSRAWEGALVGYAVRVFWVLAGVELAWTGVQLVVRQAEFSEWVGVLVNRVLFIGFFWTLLSHSGEWAGAVVNSFRTAADAANRVAGGVGGLTPSNVFDTGLEVTTTLLDQFSASGVVDQLFVALVLLVMFLCFALTATLLAVVLVESYLVVSAGVLLMGFGGSRFTSDVVIRAVQYAFSVGVKLFALQLIIGLGERFLHTTALSLTQAAVQVEGLLALAGVSLLLLGVAWAVPNTLQRLFQVPMGGQAAAPWHPVTALVQHAMAGWQPVGAAVPATVSAAATLVGGPSASVGEAGAPRAALVTRASDLTTPQEAAGSAAPLGQVPSPLMDKYPRGELLTSSAAPVAGASAPSAPGSSERLSRVPVRAPVQGPPRRPQ